VGYVENPTDKCQSDRERAADDSAIRLHHFDSTDQGVQKFIRAYDGQRETATVSESDVVYKYGKSQIASHNDKAHMNIEPGKV
jgi:hypothetical protein